MKPSLSFVLYIPLFFILTTAEPEILDMTGKQFVRNGGRHHIIPIHGGRIRLAATMKGKKICPFNVVVDPLSSSKDKVGDDFYFSHFTRDAILHESRMLSIDSGNSSVSGCNKSTVWTIPDAKGKAPSNLITTGGGDLKKCFKVVKYPILRPIFSPHKINPRTRGHTYMLQYCPLYCGSAPETCLNISSYSYKGVTRLAASTGGTPFEFGFV